MEWTKEALQYLIGLGKNEIIDINGQRGGYISQGGYIWRKNSKIKY